MRRQTRRAGCRFRFTPTRVGNAWYLAMVSIVNPVHPHAGGECGHSTTNQPVASGSPPRGWGMRRQRAGPARDSRFTPTRVGNAGVRRPDRFRCPVHPHAGGECLACNARDGHRIRFTPTRVGNAGPGSPPCRHSPVHPHAGGECSLPGMRACLRLGSPPRGWGMPTCPMVGYECWRFTPTRVGNAYHLGMTDEALEVHPHAGGECTIGHSTNGTPKVHPHAGGECEPPQPLNVDATGSPPRGWGMLSRSSFFAPFY